MTGRFGRLPRPVVFAFLVAFGLAAVVRMVAVLPGPLTPGDGGLIVVFVDDLRRAGFVMPQVTTYNFANLPFVYPPLGLYGAAFVGELLGLSSLDTVRLVAALLSLATVGAFALLALRLLPAAAAAGAVLMYALIPHAYDAIVAGGGVTRGAGILLAMLAMWVAATPSGITTRRAVSIGVLLGLAALSHPQTALYGAAASAVLVYQPGGLAITARRVVIMGLAAFLVTLPWLVLTVNSHGLDTVLAPGNRLDPALALVLLLSLTFSGSGFTDLFLVVGTLGIGVELLRRRWRLPLLLVCLLISAEGDFIGAVPWSLLGGAAIAFVLEGIGPLVGPSDRGIRVAVALVALFAALVSSMGSVVDETSRLQRVTEDHAAAMAWVRDEAELDARFIVAAIVGWGADEISEWFPAVAQRQSVATVQGTEWLGAAGYRDQAHRHRAVRVCTSSTDRCMSAWAESQGLADAWLFIPKGRLNGPLSADDCCPALRELVHDSPYYEVVYDGAGATIARPRD